MPRPPRIITSDAIYHIYQRGNNKESIFEGDDSKKFFIKQIQKLKQRFDFALLAYTIMDNHYHIIVKTGETPINEIFFNLNNIYVKYYNDKMNRSGHVFESRYNSKLVEDDTYLICLLRYVHRNPIRANIVSDINKYRWTSHYFYKYHIDNFVNSSFILNILSPNREASLKFYNNLMIADGDNDNFNKDIEIISKSFGFSILQKSNDDFYLVETTKKRPSLDEILKDINITDEIVQLIKNGCKRHNLTEYKVKFIKDALAQNYTLSEISKFLNLTPSAVSKMIVRKNII